MAIRKKSFGTHSGVFHADEVTACAFLLSYGLIDRRRILRTRNLQLLKNCEYVCDVGGVYEPDEKRFDHHLASYRGGLSSAGMILKYLKNKKIVSRQLFAYFNDHFVKGVDLHDIGKSQLIEGTANFSQVIANFLPVEYDASESKMNQAFKRALSFVLEYINILRKRFLVVEQDLKKMKQAMAQHKGFANQNSNLKRYAYKYLVLEKPFSWVEPFFAAGGQKHPALFIVMKMKDCWKLRTVPPSWKKRMQMRKPLPKTWAGLEGKKLEDKTKIPGSIFCHKGRFVAFFKTKKAVFQALEKALG